MTSLIPLIHELFVSLFAGAAMYINLVEHPARMTLPVEYAVTQWAPSYKRAYNLQGTLAAFSFFTGVASFFMYSTVTYLATGLIMASIYAFTLIVILPTNELLLSKVTMEQKREKVVGELLVKWNRLHAVRTIASFIALALLYRQKLNL